MENQEIKMKKIKKSSWGGRRKGAGRPRKQDNPEELEGTFHVDAKTYHRKIRLRVEGSRVEGLLYLPAGEQIPARIMLKAKKPVEP
jgi:hypothetical protein